MRVIGLLFSCILLVFARGVDAAGVAEILQRAESAEQSVSYRGMKKANISVRGGLATSIYKVVHLKPDKTRTEYFTPDPLAGVIVVQSGSDFWRYHPKEKSWETVPYSGLPSADSLRREALSNYDMRIVGSGVVAGRPTYVIHATPKRGRESARRIWVDRDYYLVMQTQVESSEGRILSSSGFTSIQVNPRDISREIFEVAA